MKKIEVLETSILSDPKSLPDYMGSVEGNKIMKGDISKLKALKFTASLFSLSAIPLLLRVKSSEKQIKVVNGSNPRNPLKNASRFFLKSFEDYATSIGVGFIGYTKITSEQLFIGRIAMYPNAIIVTLEMDKDKFATSPSHESEKMVLETYADINDITTKLAEYLQKNGYAAQVGSSVGGIAHYPWLGEMAGLGYRGKHGLLITPKFGPRQRVTVIFTSIENLAIAESNEHAWIRDFCNSCNKCIRSCPAKALIEDPEIIGKHSYHTVPEKCFQYFSTHQGCGVCLKECVFNNMDYEKIKKGYLKTCIIRK